MRFLPRLATFRKDEDGSSTIEAMLWFPLFMTLFALVADASLLFFGQNRAYRVLQESNRQLSVGRLNTAEELEALILGRLADLSDQVQVIAEIDNGMVTSILSIPGNDLVATGVFTAFMDLNVTVTASHYIEY